MSTTYDEIKIIDLVKDSRNQEIILPNFQREYVWKDEQQKKLISSAILKMPIGNWLLLTGKSEHFSSRLIGRSTTVDIEDGLDVRFLLDGQQRLSTLCNAFSDLYENDEDDWEKIHNSIFPKLRYRCFLKIGSIEKDGEILESPFGYEDFNFQQLEGAEPELLMNFIIFEKVDVRNKRKPFHPSNGHIYPGDSGQRLIQWCIEEEMVPLYLLSGEHSYLLTRILEGIGNKRKEYIKDTGLLSNGKDVFIDLMINKKVVSKKEASNIPEQKLDYYLDSLKKRWEEELKNYLSEVLSERVPVTILPVTEIGRASFIFDTMNSGGTPLSTFDLFAAKYAARQDAESTLAEKIVISLDDQLKEAIPSSLASRNVTLQLEQLDLTENNILSKVAREQYLNLISLLYGKKSDGSYKLDHIKRQSILRIPSAAINDFNELAIRGFLRATLFCVYRLAAKGAAEIPYTLMILPMAIQLIDDEVWKDQSKLDKIEFWYWISLFSGFYRDSQNKKSVDDIIHLGDFISGKSPNIFDTRFSGILNSQDYSDRETFLPFDIDGSRIEGKESLPGAMKFTFRRFLLSSMPRYIFQTSKKINYAEIISCGIQLHEHHLIPLGSATKIGQGTKELRRNKSHILNSILNIAEIPANENATLSDYEINRYINEINKFPISDYYLDSSIFNNDDWKSNGKILEALKQRFRNFQDKLERRLADLK